MVQADALVIPRFFIHTTENKAKSKKEGRKIFDDMECVEVRFAGNRQTVSVFPAHAICGELQDEEGDTRTMTYAQRWPDQYKRFKAKEQQVASGTPVDELPFLSQAKRSELKALSIYTAEALAALDGTELKNLGQGGRDLKNQAQAYIDNAKGSADVVRMAEELAELKQTIAELTAGKQPAAETEAVADESPFAEWGIDELKDWIAERTGERPKGNPGLATLVKRADEINTGLVKAA